MVHGCPPCPCPAILKCSYTVPPVVYTSQKLMWYDIDMMMSSEIHNIGVDSNTCTPFIGGQVQDGNNELMILMIILFKKKILMIMIIRKGKAKKCP